MVIGQDPSTVALNRFWVTIYETYIGSGDKCPCRLEWWEKSTHDPGETPTGTIVVNGKRKAKFPKGWTEKVDYTGWGKGRYKSNTFEPWKKHIEAFKKQKECKDPSYVPGSELPPVLEARDSPSSDRKRTLEFHIVAWSCIDPDCKCRNRGCELEGKQVLDPSDVTKGGLSWKTRGGFGRCF